ncbi:MAG: glycosyl hydrolase [Phycisphaerae bacterium]
MQQSELNRRDFVKLLGLTTAGLVMLCAGASFGDDGSPSENQIGYFKQLPIDDIAHTFPTPQDDARAWVYWFWMRGNVTRIGVTADLEAMQRVGIGGVLIFVVNEGTPGGPCVAGAPRLDFMGADWQEMFEFACSEAHRLGLKVNMANDPGWCGSGGPWITLETSMQKVVWTRTDVTGGRAITQQMKLPEEVDGYKLLPAFIPPTQSAELSGTHVTGPYYYRDIALLAFPVPAAAPNVIPNIKALVDGSGAYTVLQQNIPAPANWPVVPAAGNVAANSIVDISTHMNSQGQLNWDAPPGNWAILRMGHTSTGMANHPAPISGTGFESDKLSKKATKLQFDSQMGKLIVDVGALAGKGKTLVSTHIDSWETGSQNWTPTFPEDFKRLRGYDITKYLPTITGTVVENMDISERFLWDFRATISDLLVENYAAYMRELAVKHGLRLTIEGYAGVPANELDYGGQAVEPMGELWSTPRFQNWTDVIEMASAGHTFGHHIIGLETFTSQGDGFKGYPAIVKDIGDWAFCAGINRFVFHRYTMQPWTEPHYAPGMSMGPVGLHYERTETWWELTRPWHEYVARCCYLLRQGLYVADICYLQAEGGPMSINPPGQLGPNGAPPRPGYNYDTCSVEVVLKRMSVRDGRLVLPDGTNYRVLVLPESQTMTPTLLKKIKELVDHGATIIGPRPVKSPSLSNFPHCDAEVQKIAAELWDSGKIISGKTAEQVLSQRGIPPDFASDHPEAVNFCHRKMADADIYFVANGKAATGYPFAGESLLANCSFRITGVAPEFWDPETGKMWPVPAYASSDGVTSIPIVLGPKGSVFVVFRRNHATAVKDPLRRISHKGKVLLAADARLRPAKKLKISVISATYGVPGDAARTRNVKAIVQKLVDAGETSFPVMKMFELGGDPAPGVVKTLTIDYVLDGHKGRISRHDGQEVIFAEPEPAFHPILTLEANGDGHLQAIVTQTGQYQCVWASGKHTTIRVADIPKPIAIEGPWNVTFPPGWGAPAQIKLDKLIAWNQHPDAGVRYFSGTAEYQTEFDVPAELSAPGQRIELDLGNVAVMARVRVNGHDLGILWKPPFQLDVTRVLKPGRNLLNISVTNLWINRMIGDQQLPEDPERYLGPTWWHGTLKKWPQWLLDGKPNPYGRYTFTTCQVYNKTDPLVESGLIGPVKLVTSVCANFGM